MGDAPRSDNVFLYPRMIICYKHMTFFHQLKIWKSIE